VSPKYGNLVAGGTVFVLMIFDCMTVMTVSEERQNVRARHAPPTWQLLRPVIPPRIVPYLYEAVFGTAVREHFPILPKKETAPVVVLRSRKENILIHYLGPITSERVTCDGTVSIIFSKTGKHATSNAAWESAMALIVALPSDSKIFLLEEKLPFAVVTNGPPALPTPE
jgi:hypothetical protein